MVILHPQDSGIIAEEQPNAGKIQRLRNTARFLYIGTHSECGTGTKLA